MSRQERVKNMQEVAKEINKDTVERGELTEKELLQKIVMNTERTAKNVAFVSVMIIISIVLSCVIMYVGSYEGS